MAPENAASIVEKTTRIIWFWEWMRVLSWTIWARVAWNLGELNILIYRRQILHQIQALSSQQINNDTDMSRFGFRAAAQNAG